MFSARSAYRPIQNRSDNTRGELTAPVGLGVMAGSSTDGAVRMRSAVTRVGVRTQISLAATVFSLNPALPGATRYPSPPDIGAYPLRCDTVNNRLPTLAADSPPG